MCSHVTFISMASTCLAELVLDHLNGILNNWHRCYSPVRFWRSDGIGVSSLGFILGVQTWNMHLSICLIELVHQMLRLVILAFHVAINMQLRCLCVSMNRMSVFLNLLVLFKLQALLQSDTSHIFNLSIHWYCYFAAFDLELAAQHLLQVLLFIQNLSRQLFIFDSNIGWQRQLYFIKRFCHGRWLSETFLLLPLLVHLRWWQIQVTHIDLSQDPWRLIWRKTKLLRSMALITSSGNVLFGRW